MGSHHVLKIEFLSQLSLYWELAKRSKMDENVHIEEARGLSFPLCIHVMIRIAVCFDLEKNIRIF